MRTSLTLGPLFFYWAEKKWRDFYCRIADEGDVDVVYLGEVVCSKREPFVLKYYEEVIGRLQRGGKEVVLSSLAMVTTPREMEAIKQKAKGKLLVEANDLAAVQALAGKPFVVGPFINVMNEGARDYFVRLGAKRIVLPVELSGAAIGVLAKKGGRGQGSGVRGLMRLADPPSLRYGAAGARQPCFAKATQGRLDSRLRGNDMGGGDDTEIEAQVFGRQALSVAMRCYAARAKGRNKDSCRFACKLNPDGLAADAFDGKPVLTVNGSMTLSHGYVVLFREMHRMRKQGVTHFRLSPQDVDMIRVAALYRAVLDGKIDPCRALAKLIKVVGPVPFINGYAYAREGLAWVEP